MKTKIFLISLLLGFTCYTFAQEAKVYESQAPGYKTPFKRNNAGDNWFIHIGAGAQTIFGDNDAEANFADRITVIPTISLGKWFSPYWGVRLKAQGGEVHGFQDKAAYMQHDKYYNVHVDAMWNLANYWGVYSTTKSFNFTPYLGLGLAHRFQLDDKVAPSKDYIFSENKQYTRYSNTISINPGIQFGFRLSERVNLDFDLGAAIVPDYFDRYVHRAQNEAIGSATGGLTFKLGKTTFEAVEPMDFGLINELNGKINSLRAENDLLSKRPVSCPECPQVAPAVNEINYVPNVVFFRLNSSKIDANQQISVYNTANFMKETGEKIKVIGYADKNTGTSKYNLELSKKRATIVAKELTTKYNIPTEKIVVEWKGSDQQPYPQNNWNRVVIMSAQ
ncbi:membrane protein [Bacteroidia bacterium]|nr:membrane protein [Bacteroidia bacterium]